MKFSKALFFSFILSTQGFGAPCMFYENLNRTGTQTEMEANGMNGPAGYIEPAFNDLITSVWIQKGHYAYLTEHPHFQGSKLYLYGNGWVFQDNAWKDVKSNSADGGVWFNLTDVGFNDKASSIGCQKGG